MFYLVVIASFLGNQTPLILGEPMVQEECLQLKEEIQLDKPMYPVLCIPEMDMVGETVLVIGEVKGVNKLNEAE